MQEKLMSISPNPSTPPSLLRSIQGPQTVEQALSTDTTYTDRQTSVMTGFIGIRTKFWRFSVLNKEDISSFA